MARKAETMSDGLLMRQTNRNQAIAAWTIQLALAAAFMAAGSAKFAGLPMIVQIFRQIGLGDWFRYLTACVEIAGVIALLMPGFAAFGALWLAATMFFAILAHLFVLHTSPAAAVVLFVLCLVVVRLRRDELNGVLPKMR